MASGAATGAVFILLDDAVTRPDLAVAQAGRDVEWRFAPSGRPLDDPATLTVAAPVGTRCLRPLSPVHPTAAFGGDGALTLAWIRRTRIGGDAFDAVEVPIGEEVERYRITLTANGRSAIYETDLPHLTVSSAEQLARFALLPATIAIEVSQLSQSQGPGTPRLWVARRTAP